MIMPPAKKQIPTLNIGAPAAEEVKAPEETPEAPESEEIAGPTLDVAAPAPSPVEVAYAALVAIGYDEATARVIAIGEFNAETAKRAAGPEICPRGCFRQGWQGVGAGIDNVSCEHGSWSRAEG